jgi:hyaluronan synthase
VVPLPQAYGPIAERLAEKYLIERVRVKRRRSRVPSNNEVNFEDFDIPASILEESFTYALKIVVQNAKTALLQHGFQTKHTKLNVAPRAICIYQPHRNKKEIMFSNFVFSLAISSLSSSPTVESQPQIRYIWSSDSDTLVNPTTVYRTISCLDAEPNVGGATCGLSIHNAEDSLIARLASSAYWSVLSIKRGQPAVTDSVIVQPGACAAFRLPALEGVLMQWYTDRTLGVKMVWAPLLP